MRMGLVILFTFSLVTAQTNFYPDQILFDIRPQAAALQIGSLEKDGLLLKNYPLLDQLLKREGAVKVERWLTSADENDVIDGIDLSKIYRVHFKDVRKKEELMKLIEEIRQINDVQFGSLEFKHKTTRQRYIPNDPDFDRQWYLNKIMAPEAWALWGDSIPGSKEILIGVVDTGFDYLHPDLQDVLYLNSGEDVNGDGVITAVDSNNVDDDNNGYVDDFYGWDFVGPNKDAGQVPDNDVRPPQAGEGANLSHGTHVAGIIAAQTDNGIGMASISFKSKIIATKHAYDNALQYPSYIVDGYAGILYCAKLGADVINCSWGGTGGYSFYEKYVIKQASNTYGSIVVCAAGNDAQNNDNTPHYPSDFDETIAVAALGAGDEKASFSNFGEVIDISAPGMSIYSTIHANAGLYASWNGTSMASPVVAGAFALLKAWYPDSSREWLIDRLLGTADNIDAQNPSYNGKLGSGRVNVYNAIASGFMPMLSVRKYSFFKNGMDVTNALMPGDTAEVRVIIKNDPVWRPAKQVRIFAHNVEGKIAFSDSAALIGDIANGDTLSNLFDQIKLIILPHTTYEPVRIPLTIQAVTETGSPYSVEQEIEINLSLEASGFPVPDKIINVAATVANITGDRQKEIIAVDENNYCYVLQNEGSILDGFPVSADGYTTAPPVVADIDGDGQIEIVLMNRSGLLRIFDTGGNMEQEISTGKRVYGNIAAANLDSDPDLELVFGSMEKEAHVIKLDSTELTGFPVAVGGTIRYGMALVDLTNDGIAELVFGSSDKKLHALDAQGDMIAGFPLSLPARIIHTPVAVKNDDQVNIYFATNDDTVYQVDASGNIGWKYGLSEAIGAPLALQDIDGDGSVEIAAVCTDGTLHLIDQSGHPVEGFPFFLNVPINSPAVFADLNNDQSYEILVNSQTGYLYVIEANGSMYPNFPARVDEQSNSACAVADIDGDNDLEVILGGSNGVHVLDLAGVKGRNSFWMTAYGNNARTSNYEDGITAINDAQAKPFPSKFELLQNYPNPFNPSTTIEFSISQPADVQLTIYNILGEKIISMNKAINQSGLNSFIWNGTNRLNNPVSSGLYVYKITARFKNGSIYSSVKKMILIR